MPLEKVLTILKDMNRLKSLEYYLALKKKKEGNPVIYDNVDGPGRHYAKLTKPDPERQMLSGLHYLSNVTKAELMKADSTLLVARCWD